MMILSSKKCYFNCSKNILNPEYYLETGATRNKPNEQGDCVKVYNISYNLFTTSKLTLFLPSNFTETAV